ncbi:hypothetical protein [Ruminococcus flavefaciens]|uniref:hypothetical protein n=1 Tax=Ruminococcus flavefaciens TaxID=1265 RepID=UPI0026F2945C|nr:hypothetical protein [Ruminococcus flavefaciens]
MKKIILSIFSMFIVMPFCLSNMLYAKAYDNSTQIIRYYEYYNDGSYSIITIYEHNNSQKANQTSGIKNTIYYNSSNEKQWEYEINGFFNYTGSSSTCTSVSDSYSIFNNNWHINSHSCWKSGNTAYGSVTMDYKLFGITINSVSKSLNLSCSPSGVLS